MKKFLIDVVPVDFRESDVLGFDPSAILVKVIKARNGHKENEIWTIETILMGSQLLAIKGVERIGMLHF